jgi:hypothetical protein
MVLLEYLAARKGLQEEQGEVQRYGLDVRQDEGTVRIDWLEYQPISKQERQRRSDLGKRVLTKTVKPYATGAYGKGRFDKAGAKEWALIDATEAKLRDVRLTLRYLGKISRLAGLLRRDLGGADEGEV